MERWNNRVAVVTGASSGIGETIARNLVAAGLRVVALARRRELLEENRAKLSIEHRRLFYPRKCDVSNEADVKLTFAWIDKILGGTDILVNNAGIMLQGNIIDMDISNVDAVLNTNIKGVIHCTQAAVRSMRKRDFDGHIIHINSVAGHCIPLIAPGVSLNVYAPSKYAVTAINETLRNELRDAGTKIKTTSISPGAVRTQIAPDEAWEAFGNVLESEDISQVVLYVLSTPPHVQVQEVTIRPTADKF